MSGSRNNRFLIKMLNIGNRDIIMGRGDNNRTFGVEIVGGLGYPAGSGASYGGGAMAESSVVQDGGYASDEGGGVNVLAFGTKVPHTGTKLPYTGTKVPHTGTKASYTGTKASYTGTKASYTGTKASYTGTKLPHTGTKGSDNGTKEKNIRMGETRINMQKKENTTRDYSLSLSLSLYNRFVKTILTVVAVVICWTGNVNNLVNAQNTVTINNLEYSYYYYTSSYDSSGPPYYVWDSGSYSTGSTHFFDDVFDDYVGTFSVSGSGSIYLKGAINAENLPTATGPYTPSAANQHYNASYSRTNNNWSSPHSSNTSATYNGYATLNIVDERNATDYIVSSFIMNGTTSAAQLNWNGGASTSYNLTTFSGTGGTMNVNTFLTSTNATVGGNSGNPFATAVASGKSWGISGSLTAHDYFNLSGAGTTTAGSTTITGTTTSTITAFNTNLVGNLIVGVNNVAGTLNIDAGTTTTANDAFIGNSGGVGTVNVNTTWNTNDIVNIANGANGNVILGTGSNNGTWNSTVGLIQVGSSSGFTGTVTLNNDSTWTSTADIDIATNANSTGIVNIHDTSDWTAAGQTINVGLNGTGTVTQDGTGSTWTNTNSFIGVNSGSVGHVIQSAGLWDNASTRVGGTATNASTAVGDIDQSGGSHTDTEAFIGVYGTGTALIHNSGTTWVTDNAAAPASGGNNTAIIGQESTGKGFVHVYNGASWTIGPNDTSTVRYDNLITADAGVGKLEVSNWNGAAYSGTGGKVYVDGNHIIADDDLGTQGTPYYYASGNTLEHTGSNNYEYTGYDEVRGSGSTLTVTGNMTTANEGRGLLDIHNSGVTTIVGTGNTATVGIHVIASVSGSYGTDRVFDNGTLNITGQGETITGDGGRGQLKVFTGGQVKIGVAGDTYQSNHIIAKLGDSYGSDQVDGAGVNAASKITIEDGYIIAGEGYAGGYYVYYREGDQDTINTTIYTNAGVDPAGSVSRGGGDYKDPSTWLGSNNLDLSPSDASWGLWEEDAPGLAITAGGQVDVNGETASNNEIGVVVSAKDGSYAYILLDNKSSIGRSSLLITEGLIMGEDVRLNDSNDDAYMRIINGSLVQVGKDAIVAAGSGTAVTVRVNGVDTHATPNNATFRILDNLTIAKGTLGNLATTEGNLYVYDKGQVEVGYTAAGNPDGGNMTIADEANTVARTHVDGVGSKVNVDGLLTVARLGRAGAVYDYSLSESLTNAADKNPQNDQDLDPSTITADNLNKWFDSLNTLTDLKDNYAVQNLNRNAPGLLITRGAEVLSNSGSVATGTGSYAYTVIDGKDQTNTERSRWVVDGSGTNDGNLIIGDKGGAYTRVFNGGLLATTSQTNGEGDIIIADSGTYITNGTDGTSTVRVFGTNANGTRSTIQSSGDLIVSRAGSSNGQLYIYYGAEGIVGKNMTIADSTTTNAQVQVDGKGTTLKVAGLLTVGSEGSAGGYYNENRYDTTPNTAYRQDPSELGNGDLNNNIYNPDITAYTQSDWWFDSANLNLRDNPSYAGNAPGLAITDGALVESGSGLVGSVRTNDNGTPLDISDDTTGIGYVVIDNRYGYNEIQDDSITPRDSSDRSTWHLIETTVGGTTEQTGDLVIGREGRGFVRVLNGALLQVDGYTKLNSVAGTGTGNDNYDKAGEGSLYIFGNGGLKRATPDTAHWDDTNHPLEYVIPYADGNRTVWYSAKATVLGDTTGLTIAATEYGGDATLRIDNGAYGETHGIYAGYSLNSRGTVSVMGKGSELHIYEDLENDYQIANISGSGSLTVSNNALLQLHDNANITLNGMSVVSHNSLLHLNADSIVDSRRYAAKVVNARVEGIGTMTAANGVKFLYDSTYAPSNEGDPVYQFVENNANFKFADKVSAFTSTQIDPGLYYGWATKDEYYDRYGTLTFGDRLELVGNVTTLIDVNSGWPSTDTLTDSKDNPVPAGKTGEDKQMNDMLVVQRNSTSPSNADVVASLSGTLKIHARLTGYFQEEPSFEVVRTLGDDVKNSGTFVSGKVIRMFDKLEVVPWRFFETPHQEIVEETSTYYGGANNATLYTNVTNESLVVSMKLKTNPFEEAGTTYNEKSTGAALDSIYKLRDDDWLPVLRYFWYLGDPEFLDAYRSFSGEIRAHSLLMPLQNPWIYNQNRFGFRPCPYKDHKHGYDRPELLDPCEMAELAKNINGCSTLLERLKRQWDKCKKDVRIWGQLLNENSEFDGDGNSGSFKLVRNGGVVGIDKPTQNGLQYFGFQFAFAETELDAYRAEAKAADFNFGIYHARKVHNVFEWRNYLGMGIQDYKTKRSIDSGISNYTWVWDTPNQVPSNNPADGHYEISSNGYDGVPRSSYRGYTFYANTEFARPFILGSCKQYMIRPFAAVDVIGTWQNSASERGTFQNSHLVKLDFRTSSYIRTYARTGVTFERNGDYSNLHAGLSYNFLMGGRHYANTDNHFQFGGNDFNIRSTDTGNDFLNLNCGAELYLGRRRNQTLMINYQALLGKNITSQNAQVGYQYKF
jgi:hypothetical protein